MSSPNIPVADATVDGEQLPLNLCIMGQTCTALYYHVVFSTHSRMPVLSQANEERIWNYLGGIARENDCQSLKVGGYRDHIHMLLSIPAKLAASSAVQRIKAGSSAWINDEGLCGPGRFRWQNGYGAFTVGQSQILTVRQYIANQREHHRSRSFQEEYLAMLRKYQIEVDERYLWD